MSNLAKLLRPQTTSNRLFEATVERIEGDNAKVLLKPDPPDGGEQRWATIALAGEAVHGGDRVLAIGDGAVDVYVIGIVGRPKRERILRLEDGAYAKLDQEHGSERLSVYGADRVLQFAYLAAENRLIVGNPEAGLTFRSKGNLRLESEQGISIEGAHIELAGRTSGARENQQGARIAINPKKIAISSEQFDLISLAGNVIFKRLRVNSDQVMATAQRLRLAAGRLERKAETIVEKAKQVFQTVEGIVQRRAGRMKTHVDETYHMKSERAYIKTKKDYKVKSDKIHLG